MSRRITRLIFVPTVLITLMLVSTSTVQAEKVEKYAITTSQIRVGGVPCSVSINGNSMHLRNCEEIMLTVTDSSGLFTPLLKVITDININLSTGYGNFSGTSYSCDVAGDPVPNGFTGKFEGQLFPSSLPDDLNYINEIMAWGYGEYEGVRVKMTSAFDGNAADVRFLMGIVTDTRKD